MKIKVDVSDGKNIFFISDFHLWHKNVIGFDNRPFLDEAGNPDVLAMHQTIIKNWNDTVGDNDIVFYLGDLVFGRKEWANSVIFALRGKIHYIIGNHDKYNDVVDYKRFESVNDYVDLNIDGDPEHPNEHFVLMHYPIYSWNRMHHGSSHIHGHSHGNLHHGESADYYKNRRVIDVGCNVINYTPISYKEIISRFKNIKTNVKKKQS